MFDFLTNKLSSIFSTISDSSRLTEKNIKDALNSVQDALLQADVPYDLVQVFIENVKKEVIGQKVIAALKPGEQLVKVVHDQLKDFLGDQKEVKKFEFQLLKGVRDKLKPDLVEQGFIVSDYIPYGTNWLPYSIRRLRERKRNIFLLGSSFIQSHRV